MPTSSKSLSRVIPWFGRRRRSRGRAGHSDDRASARPGADTTNRLFIAFLVLLLWLPVPLGSARPLYWTAMEIWVYLLAAFWLFKYARGRVDLTRAFRRARPALILLGLWLAYGLVQMVPLPGGVLEAVSPNAAAFHRDAASVAALDAQPLPANPDPRPLPSVPADLLSGDGGGDTDGTDGQTPAPAIATIAFEPSGTSAGGYTGRLTLDLPASVEAWFKSLAYVLVFALTLLLVDSPRRLKILAYVLVFSGLAQAVYGSLSLALSTGGVATGSFINRNHFAAYLVLCLSVGIGLLLASLRDQAPATTWRERLRRIGRVVLSSRAPLRFFLAIMVIALVLTHSRMGNASFFAAMLIAGAAALLLQKQMPRPAMILIASLIVIDLLIIGSWVGIDKVRDRLVETTLATEIRDETSQHSLKLWRDYPLLGSGAGSYYLAYMRYREGDDGAGILYHAHNDYLEFGSEYGLVGLALLGSVIVLGIVQAALAQRKRRDPFARGMGLASLMAISAMLIHASVEFNSQIPAYAVTFMAILAMAWLSLHLRDAGSVSQGGSSGRRRFSGHSSGHSSGRSSGHGASGRPEGGA